MLITTTAAADATGNCRRLSEHVFA